MNTTKQNPLERLKYHVTGAIERGEKSAIIGRPTRETRDQSNETRLARLTEAEAKANMQGAYITLADGRTQYCEHLSEREREACANYAQVTAQRDELLALVIDAREGRIDAKWLARALAAIARCEASHLSNSESNTAKH